MQQLISPVDAEQNRRLHVEHAHYGETGAQWAAYVERLVEDEGHQSICDYGAGKGVLAQALARIGVAIAEYDPAVPGKEDTPEPADLVVCTDVLEHVSPAHIDAVLAHLASLTKRKLLFDICIIPAKKTLADGRNAHLIVQRPDWWRYKLAQHFDIVHWVEREGYTFVYGEAVPKGTAGDKPVSGAPKRRKMSIELSQMCEQIRRQSAAHCDAYSRIKSVRLFEGVDDGPADMQVLFDVLDEVDYPAPILRAAAKIARKAVMVRVRTTQLRNEAYWRKLLEQHWRVIDWQVDAAGRSIGMVGCPRVAVEGLRVLGAVESEERWGQVEAAMARITKRVQTAEPHGRRAILACYGPSLNDTIRRLKDDLADGAADVISVSGAHDLLIAHGVVPTYHVECDPRPHKADNIDKGHPAVQYLLGSVVHPKLLDKLDDLDVALWHVATQEHAAKLLKLGEHGHLIITGGGSVGLRAIPLLYAMGYRDFAIYGMDCSFADEGREQWAGKHAGKRHEVLMMQSAGRVFATSPVLLSYATDFIEMVQKVTDAQFRLYGEGLLQQMCAVHAQLAEPEASPC